MPRMRTFLLAIATTVSASEDCGNLPPAPAPTAPWFTQPKSSFTSVDGNVQTFVGAADTAGYSNWGSSYSDATLKGDAVLDPIMIFNGLAAENLGLLGPYSFVELVVLTGLNPAIVTDPDWLCNPKQRMTRADVEVTRPPRYVSWRTGSAARSTACV